MMYQSTIFIAVLTAITTLVVPRKYMLLPYIVTACFVPADQRIIIFGLDFTAIRLLILVGALRIMLSSGGVAIRCNKFDKIVFAWAITGAVIYVSQWRSMSALILRCGVLFDILGLYWIFRKSVCSWRDVKFAVFVLSVCVLLMAPLIALEWSTGSNPFVLLGMVTTDVRIGNVRCQASFPHAAMMGLFWATLVPLFIGVARIEKNKLFYWSAVGAGIFCVVATASATPVMTLLVILLVIGAYKWRRYTGQAWKAFFLSLVALHIVMDAPVWHLIGRIHIFGGSGWHRYNLIDQAIKHFNEWMFLGSRSTEHWGWGLQDITNQFVLEGVRGGLLLLVLFIVMLVTAFRALQHYFKRAHSEEEQWLAWCVFVALLGHCIAFLGVSYFGQIGLLWLLMQSMVGFVAEENEKAVDETVDLLLRLRELPIIANDLPSILKHK